MSTNNLRCSLVHLGRLLQTHIVSPRIKGLLSAHCTTSISAMEKPLEGRNLLKAVFFNGILKVLSGQRSDNVPQWLVLFNRHGRDEETVLFLTLVALGLPDQYDIQTGHRTEDQVNMINLVDQAVSTPTKGAANLDQVVKSLLKATSEEWPSIEIIRLFMEYPAPHMPQKSFQN